MIENNNIKNNIKIDKERREELENLQDELGYRFQDLDLLQTAFTHSSYANENKEVGENFNERLEFLGDSVVDLVVSETLYREYPHAQEGTLTKIRSQNVCETSFAKVANKLHLGDYLLLGKGEEASGGRKRPSILADTFEALCAAIYLDGGFQKVSDFLVHLFELKFIDIDQLDKSTEDFKTELQELLHRKGKRHIHYKLDKSEGPDHDKTFYMSVYVDNKKIGSGRGANKKEAERNAAKEALGKMEKDEA